MTGERDPNIVTSGLSGTVTEQGITVEVHIIRLEDELGWTLEVVNHSGTSTVWDDPFATDDAAWTAFRRTVEEEGMRAFLDQAVVIPFKR
jgi:uncharacterized protein